MRTALATMVATLAVTGAAAGPAAAQEFSVGLSGVIAVEQSGTAGVEPGNALLRPDGSFVSGEHYGLGQFPALSDDGRRLATSYGGCIFFTEWLERPIPGFPAPACEFGTEPKAIEPVWSPDGEHVAFVGESTVSGRTRRDIYVREVDGGSLRRLTDDGQHKSDPQWRVDGRIAFVLQHDAGGPSDIYSVRWDAQTPQRPDRETSGTDAKYISFPDLQSGIGAAAYVASGNTSSVPDRLIVGGIEVLTAPTWSLRGVAWEPGASPDHLVVAVGPGGGDELLIVSRGGTIERRLPVRFPHDPDWRPEPTPAGGAGGQRPGTGAGSGDPVGPRRTRPADPREHPLRVPDGIAGAPGRLRASRAGAVALELGCPDPVACRVAVTASVVAASAPRGRATAAARRGPPAPRGRASVSARGVVHLATRRYTVPAGTARRVQYRLPAAARRLLRKRGRLTARFEVSVTGVRARQQVRQVTLLPSRARR